MGFYFLKATQKMALKDLISYLGSLPGLSVVKELSFKWERRSSPNIRQLTKNKKVDKSRRTAKKIVIGIDKSTTILGDSYQSTNGILKNGEVEGGAVVGQESDKTEDKMLSRIKETSNLINSGLLEEARKKLFQLLGEARSEKVSSAHFAKIYNNIGITYNITGENYSEAVKYFEISLESDPNYLKARVNLIFGLSNRGEREDLSKALTLARGLWKQKKDDNTLQALLWAIGRNGGPKAALKELEENDPEVQKVLKKHPRVATLIANIEIENGLIDKALSHVENSLIRLPEDSRLQFQKARALILKAQKEDQIHREKDIIPIFKKYDLIDEAINILEVLKDKVEKGDKESEILRGDINYSLASAFMWKGREKDAMAIIKELKLNKDVINDDEIQHSLNVFTFACQLSKKQFEMAYETLENDPFFEKIPYHEKRRVSRVLILRGAIEQSLKLLLNVYEEAVKLSDPYFFFDLSAVYILLDRKSEAIKSGEKALEIASKLDDEVHKLAFSHRNAIYFHYAKPEDGEDSETVRLLAAMDEHQKTYPEDRVLTSFQALDEKGELTEELRAMLLKQKESYDQIQEIFRSHPIPTYMMAKLLNKDFSEFVTHLDYGFQIPFTDVSQEFTDLLEQRYSETQDLVFDYLSLLDLSKMGLISYLEKLDKRLWVSQGLFETIQADLIKKETPELRRLWEFLRKNEQVNFFPEGEEIRPYSEESKKFEKFFDEWLISSISFAKENGYVLVTNDLRLLQYLEQDSIESVNIFPFIKKLRESREIDKITYSRTLGDLAERFYVFIPFDADDLFNIVMEDKGEITPRSYHLVMQIEKQGSVQATFFPVFTRFLEKIWSSGVESENKVKWFSFITKAILIKIKPVFGAGLTFDESVQEQAKEAAANLGNFNRVVAQIASEKEKKIILEKLEDIYAESKYFSALRDRVKILFSKIRD